jgi:hypothetical protein
MGWDWFAGWVLQQAGAQLQGLGWVQAMGEGYLAQQAAEKGWCWQHAQAPGWGWQQLQEMDLQQVQKVMGWQKLRAMGWQQWCRGWDSRQ